MRREVGDMSEEYPNINFSDARLTDEDVIAILSPAKAREYKKLTKQMDQARDAQKEVQRRLYELGEDPSLYEDEIVNRLGKIPTGSPLLQEERIRALYEPSSLPLATLFSNYDEPLQPRLIRRRLKKQEGGELDAQMSDMMEGPTHTMPDGTVMPGATHGEYEEMMQEEAMVPDERMEEDFVDYVTESALEPEDTMYLEEALAADPRLSEIFDQVVETASEFSGSGPVEGPGSEVSDSIPARLSDGEFVITSKATEEIGPENLQGMMEQAEMDADVRREAAEGGMIVDEDDAEASYPVKRTVDPTEREMRKLQLAANPRTQYRTVYG